MTNLLLRDILFSMRNLSLFEFRLLRVKELSHATHTATHLSLIHI